MASPTEELHILIVGAGPTGLLIAHGLQELNIKCTVFEQDTAARERSRDWNFGIYWAQDLLAECLPAELIAQLSSAQTDSIVPSKDDYISAYNGKTGESLGRIPSPFVFRLQWKKLVRLLAAGVDVQYQKTPKRCQSDGSIVSLLFEDGTQASGNLLIGAEGARSKVREFLLNPDKARLHELPLAGIYTTACLSASEALSLRQLHPRTVLAYHPNNSMGFFGVHDAKTSDDPSQWPFMIYISYPNPLPAVNSRASSELSLPGTPPASMSLPSTADSPANHSNRIPTLADMKHRASAFAEPFSSAIASISDGTKVWGGVLYDWPTPLEGWDNRRGTVTLAGDAAHPMTPHRGQGANNAVHDAATFIRLLRAKSPRSQSELANVVCAYEKEMIPRGHAAVLSSRENALALHDWERVLSSKIFTVGVGKDEGLA